MIFIKIEKVEKLEIKGRRYVCLADAVKKYRDKEKGKRPLHNCYAAQCQTFAFFS